MNRWVKLLGVLGLVIVPSFGCARTAILDTALNQGQRIVTIRTTEDAEKQPVFEIEFSPVNRGGVMNLKYGYKATDPERGYVVSTDGAGAKLYTLREGNDDHRLTLKDQSLMTGEFKYEWELRTDATADQFTQFIQVLNPDNYTKLSSGEIWQINNANQAFVSACDDELSIAIRRSVNGYASFPHVQTDWSAETDRPGVSVLDDKLLTSVNNYLQASTNCPFKLTSATMSNINIDEKTREFLQGQAQIAQRTESYKAQIEQFNQLLKEVSPNDRDLVKGMILGNGGEVNIHLGEE